MSRHKREKQFATVCLTVVLLLPTAEVTAYPILSTPPLKASLCDNSNPTTIPAVPITNIPFDQHFLNPEANPVNPSNPDNPVKETEPGTFTRHRLYSATLNRFLSPDPLGPGGGPNLYEYALGNPLAYIDLSHSRTAAVTDWLGHAWAATRDALGSVAVLPSPDSLAGAFAYLWRSGVHDGQGVPCWQR